VNGSHRLGVKPLGFRTPFSAANFELPKIKERRFRAVPSAGLWLYAQVMLNAHQRKSAIHGKRRSFSSYTEFPLLADSVEKLEKWGASKIPPNSMGSDVSGSMPSGIGYGGFRRISRQTYWPPTPFYAAGSEALQNFDRWPKKSFSTVSAQSSRSRALANCRSN
jgi:hypothetical protein